MQVSGRNPLKIKQVPSKIPDVIKPSSPQPQPALSRSEILKALDLPLFDHELEASDHNEFVSRIEKEANKIHESLKQIRSPDKSYHDPHSEENRFPRSESQKSRNSERKESINSNHNKGIPAAYDSDPEYQNYQGSPRQELSPQKALSEERIRLNNSHSRSPIERVGYSDYGLWESKEQKAMKFTIPKPFRFESRETGKAATISKRRFLEDLEEKKRKDNEICRKKFRAIPIPEHIKDRDLYSKIIQKQNERRKEVKKNSKILTLQREKPFSFYLRDKNRAQKKTPFERKEYRFTANAIPWICSVPLLAMMNEKGEAERKERVAKEAQYLMAVSHLPSRMEKHEQERKIKELKGQQGGKQAPHRNFTFQPAKRKPVPEFERLQENFQTLLDRKRSNKRPIIPKPFDFALSKRAQKREYLDQENMVTKLAMTAPKHPVFVSHMPVVQPPSTKKWEQSYELNKRRQEEAAKKILEEEKAQKERERKRLEIEIRVRSSPAIIDNTKALEERQKKAIEGRKAEIKKTEADYKKKLEEIKDNVRKRLLLVENYEEGSRKARNRKLREKQNKL